MRRHKHKLRSGCKHRTISIYEFKNLGHMPTGMHAAAHGHPHCHLDMHIPSMLACRPARYTPSPLFPPFPLGLTRSPILHPQGYVQPGPMQSFPQCTGLISVYKDWVRCKHGMLFLFALGYMCANVPQLQMAYVMKFQGNAKGRRAFIVRSHGILPAELMRWINIELQNV